MTLDELCTTFRPRIEALLDRVLPAADQNPARLHEAMRYSVLGGGKRIRPLLVYAAGQALDAHPDLLDAPAAAIELMHAFSLVHDDLPAMDNDDLRRGRPTTHRQFDEATAILAADALQPLAFQVLASHPPLAAHPQIQIQLSNLLADACGSTGMTGGQAIDMSSEGRRLDRAALEHMYHLKTGRLLAASVLSAACCRPDTGQPVKDALERFATAVGLAFQIRDDILDVEGNTAQIGKQQGSDQARGKATYPALLGMDNSRKRVDELLREAREALATFGSGADSLRELAAYIVLRKA